jgi:steroid delta-isomerase-like uncharacterized protein
MMIVLSANARKARGGEMGAADGERVMRRYLTEVVAQGRIELLEDLAAEDMVDHTAVAAEWGEGRQGLEKHVRYFRRVVPDLEVEVERVIASDDEVVGIWRATGTHAGSLFGVPATGRRVDYRNASVFRVRDGRIVDYTGVWGALDAVRQMGVPIQLPSEATAP